MRFLGRSGDRSEPVAAEFAGIPDGRTLWLAIPVAALDDDGWAVVLRDRAGTTSDLGAAVDDGYLHVRAALPTRPGPYDVLATRDEVARPVASPGPPDGPTRIPVRDGLQAALVTDDDGLRITVEPAEAVAVVLSITSDHASVTIVVEGQSPGRLLLVAKGAEVGSLALAAGDRGLEATIQPEDVPVADVRLVLEGGDGRLPVRRAANGLVAPDKAVLLPRIEDVDGTPLLVCAWGGAGDLRLRRPSAPAARGARAARAAR